MARNHIYHFWRPVPAPTFVPPAKSLLATVWRKTCPEARVPISLSNPHGNPIEGWGPGRFLKEQRYLRLVGLSNGGPYSWRRIPRSAVPTSTPQTLFKARPASSPREVLVRGHAECMGAIPPPRLFVLLHPQWPWVGMRDLPCPHPPQPPGRQRAVCCAVGQRTFLEALEALEGAAYHALRLRRLQKI